LPNFNWGFKAIWLRFYYEVPLAKGLSTNIGPDCSAKLVQKNSRLPDCLFDQDYLLGGLGFLVNISTEYKNWFFLEIARFAFLLGPESREF